MNKMPWKILAKKKMCNWQALLKIKKCFLMEKK